MVWWLRSGQYKVNSGNGSVSSCNPSVYSGGTPNYNWLSGSGYAINGDNLQVLCNEHPQIYLL